MELTQEQHNADLQKIANAVIQNMRFNRNGMLSMGRNSTDGTWSVQDLFTLEDPSLNAIFGELKKTKLNLEGQVEIYEDPKTGYKIDNIEKQMEILRIASKINKAHRTAQAVKQAKAKEIAKNIASLKAGLEVKRVEKILSKETNELEAEIAKLEQEQKEQGYYFN